MRYKLFPVIILLFLPFMVFAAGFERDLYFGIRNDQEVKGLQEFLQRKGLYSGPVNGNFFSLTREAVKKFQQQERIEPSMGYFGPKTRTRANALNSSLPQLVSKEEQMVALVVQIQALREQLKTLQEKLIQEQKVSVAATTSTIDSVPSVSTAGATPSPIIRNPWVEIAGQATSTFLAIESAFFKIGEFTVYNGSSSSVLFANFETEVVDEMDSVFNRNRKVNFLLRDGIRSIDTLISSTEFTFIETPPKIGKPHISALNLAFDVRLKPGEEKVVSFWIEQMKYVRSGTLQIRSTKTVMVTGGASVTGKWNFVLTKEPPL